MKIAASRTQPKEPMNSSFAVPGFDKWRPTFAVIILLAQSIREELMRMVLVSQTTEAGDTGEFSSRQELPARPLGCWRALVRQRASVVPGKHSTLEARRPTCD